MKGEQTGNWEVNYHAGGGGGCGGSPLPPSDWLTDGKKRKSLMTPTLLPPSREEPDGTKAPHCCPLTQDHQSPGNERGTGGRRKDGAGVGQGELCVYVCGSMCVRVWVVVVGGGVASSNTIV